MNFFIYLKDKSILIIIYILNLILTFSILFVFNVQKEVIFLISGLNLIVSIILIYINYKRKRKFYNDILFNLKKLDKKYLILETLPHPLTYEEQIMTDILYDINKSMIEEIKKLENNVIDFKEFVEMWIHEVKIPISSLVLKCHNNKDKYDLELNKEIRRLDNYIDQVLYYVRSENAEKDFLISEVKLVDITRNVILKNKDDLLENNIDLEVKNVDFKVHTDKKWLEFIINQIINNSIKYKKNKEAKIKIEANCEKNIVILNIIDNGIGIPNKDIKRVFEKSFTGDNGRNKAKSTGMGLYICKNLCNKLGHSIEIESKQNEYTSLKIIFNNDDYYKF